MEESFWTAIAAAPDDDLPKLALADWLDDRNDPRAACIRWLVANHKRPAFDRIDTNTWDWWSRMPAQPIHYEIGPRHYVLPLNLFSRLTPPGLGLWKHKPSYAEAMRDLCAAWGECVCDGADPLADDCPRAEQLAR
jgi:uncharacterized protein (TIGR02996 family)